ncbi:MAG: hypothetical protein Q8W46_12690, partial [Candidatus Palauibacterales bacterium]|nr:hypothetical protein [Candidatus Palauibacterales bacterium]
MRTGSIEARWSTARCAFSRVVGWRGVMTRGPVSLGAMSRGFGSLALISRGATSRGVISRGVDASSTARVVRTGSIEARWSTARCAFSRVVGWRGVMTRG